MGAIYRLTLAQLASRGRLAVMTVLATMPVVIAILMLRSATAPTVQEFESAILSAMLAGAIGPLIVLALAAPSFSNEIEDRTLANLTLTPVPRWRIVLPKLLAAITLAGPFMVASALATSWVAFLGDPRAMAAVTTAALAGVAMYASAFVWLGLVSTQAIGVGLLYIVLWEGFFAGFVAGVRMLSIRHYAIGLMHGLDASRFAWGAPLPFGVAITMSVVVIGGFLVLSVRRLRRMDVP